MAVNRHLWFEHYSSTAVQQEYVRLRVAVIVSMRAFPEPMYYRFDSGRPPGLLRLLRSNPKSANNDNTPTGTNFLLIAGFHRFALPFVRFFPLICFLFSFRLRSLSFSFCFVRCTFSYQTSYVSFALNRYLYVPVDILFFPMYFFHSRVSGACPATADCIVLWQ